MKVIKLAHLSQPVVLSCDSVMEAVQKMKDSRVAAAAVVDDDRLVGMFSERELMLRVVARGKDPDQTKVTDVMTTKLERVSRNTESVDALKLMVEKHIHHLPIVDARDGLLGLVSIRRLLQNHVEDLTRELNSLEAYFTADGPGG